MISAVVSVVIAAPLPRRLRPSPGRRPRCPWNRIGDGGFLLPLASMLSLLLLLSSLSVQAVSLQGQRRGAMEQQLRESEDRLASAAQALVARIQLRHGCLLPLELRNWPTADCVDAADLAALSAGELHGLPWRLLRWQPAAAPSGATALEVELLIAPSHRQGESGPIGAWSLRLTGRPWRVFELRPLGLRGEAS